MLFDLSPVIRQRFFDNNGAGAPLAGGQLFSYVAGTTTPLATYTDSTGSTPNANPVILDANGYANVWMSQSNYKFVLADSLGNILWTQDNVKSIQQMIADQINLAGSLAVTNNLSDVANKATAFNNITPTTTIGDTIYGGASGVGTRLPGNTTATKKFLSETGDGVNATAPVWQTIAAIDVPTLNQNTTGTASNITGTSNSTLTTLSALALPVGQLTGTLGIGAGGTGQVTANAALNALLPTQTSNGGKFLQTNATNTSWVSVTATAASNVVSKTANYSAVANDYILASSSSFAITLPTAVGISGQSITVQHNGTSLTNVYGINTTSSQTVGGLASGAIGLYTNGEVFVFTSDNANWQIQSHKTDTGRILNNSGLAPSAGFGTVTSPSYWYKRVDGSEAEVTMSWVNGTVAASTAAVTLPFTIDSTKLPSNAAGTIVGLAGKAVVGGSIGIWANNLAYLVFYDGSTTNQVFLTTNTGSSTFIKTNGNANWGNSEIISVTFKVPIAGWQP